MEVQRQTLALQSGVLDLQTGLLVTAAGERRLTGTELALLRYLVEHQGRPVSRGELLSQVWGRPPTTLSRAPDDTMRRLRAKIEREPSAPRHLITVHGAGYRFNPGPTPRGEHDETAVPAPQTLALETGVMDMQTGVLFSDRGEIRLSTMELALLAHLAARPGVIVSRTQLLREAWGYAPGVTSRAADDTMHRLRTKVECDPGEPRHLLTVHGGGYRFVPSEPLVDDALDYGAVRIDFDRHIVARRDGAEETLTAPEAILLSTLAAQDGGVVSRAELLRGLRRRGLPAKRRSIDALIQRLRRRIEPDPSSPHIIINVRGRGYRLAPPPPLPPVEDLPALRSTLIGRRGELRRLDALLSEPGITCITGPGGMGKTTLALHAAHRAAGWQSVSGVIFVDVGGLSDPNLLIREMAARVRPGLVMRPDPVSALARALRAMRFPLVVLDCIDRLVPDGVDILVQLCSLAPRARLLVTTRFSPGLDRLLRLGPMPTEEAVELFAQRAPEAVRDGGSLSRLVEKLDCVPLAVELATRRSGQLSPEQMHERLDERLDLLSADHPETARHASLRASVTWSWEMLPEMAQEALACCGLFKGPFTAADFAAVVGQDDDTAARILESLIAASLVVPAQVAALQGVRFFRLLDILAQFAREFLEASPDSDRLTVRFVCAMADRGESLSRRGTLFGDPRAERLRVVALPNLLAASARALDQRQAARLLLCLSSLLRQSSRTALLIDKLQQTLSALPPRLQYERGHLSQELAFVFIQARRLDEAENLLRTSLDVATDTDDTQLLSRVYAALGMLAWTRGAFDEAKAHLLEALETCRQHGVLGITASVHTLLGNLANLRGRYAEGLKRYQQTLAMLPSEGFYRLRGGLMYNIASSDLNRGRMAAAEFHYRRAMELARLGDRPTTVLKSRCALGLIAWCTGRPSEGRRMMAEGIRALEANGDREGAAAFGSELGKAMLLDGDHAASERVLRHCLHAARAPWTRVPALSLLAACEALGGRSADARATLDEAERMEGDTGLRVLPRIIRFAMGDGPHPTLDATNAEWNTMHIGHAWQAAALLDPVGRWRSGSPTTCDNSL